MFEWSEEHLMIREAVRRFVDEEIGRASCRERV